MDKDRIETAKLRAEMAAAYYAGLPIEAKLDAVARTFGKGVSGISTHPCRGDWRGTSDVSVDFDDGTRVHIGNHLTPKAKTKGVRNEMLAALLSRHNPEVAELRAELGMEFLREMAERDNAVARALGLKEYAPISIEVDWCGHHIEPWTYAVLDVDGEIVAHLETGLRCAIESMDYPDPALYDHYRFAAGGLRDEDVDYVMRGCGHSTTGEYYKHPLSPAELARAIERRDEMISKRPRTAPPVPTTSAIKNLLSTRGAPHAPQAARRSLGL